MGLFDEEIDKQIEQSGKLLKLNDRKLNVIEMFSGYGSQCLGLKYLGLEEGKDFVSHRTCEWAVNSILAYKNVHRPARVTWFDQKTGTVLIAQLVAQEALHQRGGKGGRQLRINLRDEEVRNHERGQLRHERRERHTGRGQERITRSVQHGQIMVRITFRRPHAGEMLAAGLNTAAEGGAIPHPGMGDNALRIIAPAAAGQRVGMRGG